MSNLYALLTLEDRLPTQKPIQVDYGLSVPQLVISLYEQRYGYNGQPKSLEKVRGTVNRYLNASNAAKFHPCSKADGLIGSMDLFKDQREEIVRLAEQRRERDHEIQQQRWRQVEKEIVANLKSKIHHFRNDTEGANLGYAKNKVGEEEGERWETLASEMDKCQVPRRQNVKST